MAKAKPPAVKIIRMPDQFPEQPWKKKKVDDAPRADSTSK